MYIYIYWEPTTLSYLHRPLRSPWRSPASPPPAPTHSSAQPVGLDTEGFGGRPGWVWVLGEQCLYRHITIKNRKSLYYLIVEMTTGVYPPIQPNRPGSFGSVRGNETIGSIVKATQEIKEPQLCE